MRALCETDVLVAGGGPAGIGAALGAARKGVRADGVDLDRGGEEQDL